jgi:pilus assembly protein FimV
MEEAIMDGIGRHLSYANVAATLALVLAMSGGAIAATGGFSSGGKLQACVSEGGIMRLAKAGQKCKKGQTEIAWNQTGPDGPKGTPGAAGAPGTAGAAGAPGAKGAEGPKGASGESATVKWASINAGGGLRSAHGVVAAPLVEGKQYAVAFDSDITNCAIVATSNEPADENATITTGREGTEVFVYVRENEHSVIADFSIAAYC